ncbi:tRNA (adenosine(37)-N6)-threonylcarbamoyltransferase complex ATPase subunit type 1 TsaE [Litoribrevibacter albus]|uniref:tRNA threonylcarbamoyladenosine biosynthesis protein TsaE n=1 Tax=Litoribrevibacter albus TaxID=1473156 RepID=A0AA37S7J4_9GAMM|nr:tRNA (adenosine(37)-N6)-threonylcarbamoyltransferase complex ATPase subunit type 1 TsaE [Litoribrevibacter albus]GLQ30630.1 tRNA (adenosine(37)-N6)-threonylcarbamoyltransferase complex ATPase subunit type 1 TsaE [Litoribrevibacter albus]
MLFSRYLDNETETLWLAGQFATVLKGTGVVYLHGHLGAGKTTFCRGVLSAYGHSGAVKSPTYTLVEPYKVGGYQVYHFDLYRLSDPEELEYMGIRDYFEDQALCLVEWPSQGEGVLPDPDLHVRLQADEGGRFLEIESSSDYGRNVLVDLENFLSETQE